MKFFIFIFFILSVLAFSCKSSNAPYSSNQNSFAIFKSKALSAIETNKKDNIVNESSNVKNAKSQNVIDFRLFIRTANVLDRSYLHHVFSLSRSKLYNVLGDFEKNWATNLMREIALDNKKFSSIVKETDAGILTAGFYYLGIVDNSSSDDEEEEEVDIASIITNIPEEDDDTKSFLLCDEKESFSKILIKNHEHLHGKIKLGTMVLY